MSLNNSSSDRQHLWKRIADDFRRACLLRREGKAAEAADLLEKQLPETISAWGRVSGLRDPERRAKLNDLFELEQRRVDDIWLSQQIIVSQLRDILIPSLCLQVAEEVREVMELQAVHLGEVVEQISRRPAPDSVPAQASSPNRAGTTRIVKLPEIKPVERRALPNFDDLPNIIDDLLTGQLRATALDSRMVALV